MGFLVPMSRDAISFQVAAFRKGLNDTGFVDGTNLSIDYRWANDQNLDQVPTLAAALVSRPVKIIATFTTVGAQAAKSATSTIPVVFVTGDDPVAAGLVASLSRPETNLTGVGNRLGHGVGVLCRCSQAGLNGND